MFYFQNDTRIPRTISTEIFNHTRMTSDQQPLHKNNPICKAHPPPPPLPQCCEILHSDVLSIIMVTIFMT